MQFEIISWLSQNRTWVFSGIGVAVPIAIVGWLLSRGRAKRSQGQQSGAGSSNLQAGRDINVAIHAHEGRKSTSPPRSQARTPNISYSSCRLVEVSSRLRKN